MYILMSAPRGFFSLHRAETANRAPLSLNRLDSVQPDTLPSQIDLPHLLHLEIGFAVRGMCTIAERLHVPALIHLTLPMTSMDHEIVASLRKTVVFANLRSLENTYEHYPYPSELSVLAQNVLALGFHGLQTTFDDVVSGLIAEPLPNLRVVRFDNLHCIDYEIDIVSAAVNHLLTAFPDVTVHMNTDRNDMTLWSHHRVIEEDSSTLPELADAAYAQFFVASGST